MEDTSGKIAKQGITEQAVAGFRWKLYITASTVVMQLSFGVILARLLPPEAFGLFLYAVTIVGLISIYAEAGLREAIIQRQELTKEHVRAGFTLSLFISLSASVGLWIFAPIIASETGLSVLRVVSLLFFISGLGAVSGALLEKQLNFRLLFWAELVSYGVGQGVISISLAALGFGVWSLAYGVLCYRLIQTAAYMLMAPPAIGFPSKKVP